MLLIYTDQLCVCVCVTMHAHANINTLIPHFHHLLRWQPGLTPLFWPFLLSLIPFAFRLISCSHRCCWEGQSVRPQHPPLLLSSLWCYTQSFALACPWSGANHRHSTSLSNSILSIWLLKASIANISARETSSSLSFALSLSLMCAESAHILALHVFAH